MEQSRGIYSGSLLVCERGILSKSWHVRWCVLYPDSEKGPPTIEIFDSEAHSIKHPNHRRVINLGKVEEIKTERLHSKPKGFEHGFEIVTHHHRHTFGVDSETGLNSWIRVLHQQIDEYQNRMANHLNRTNSTTESDDEEDCRNLYMDDNIIYESADPNAVPIYRVQIDINETAKRFHLHGWYYLAINPVNLALIDCNTRKALYQWPYRFIRRFGKTEQVFQFESGRRCLSGVGNFIFYTTEGHTIYENVNFRTKQIRHQEEINNPNSIQQHDKIADSVKIIPIQESYEKGSADVNKEIPVPDSKNPDDQLQPRSKSIGQAYTVEHNSRKELSKSLPAERNNNHNTVGPSHFNNSFKQQLELKLKPNDDGNIENESLPEKSEKSDISVETKQEKDQHAVVQKTVSGTHMSEKKKKQEEKKRKEEEEKERKKRLKEEEKRKKEEQKRLKEEQKKNKKSEKKKSKPSTTSPPVDVYDEPRMLNAYEDIHDLQPEDTGMNMYAEAALSPPKPVFASKKQNLNPKSSSKSGLGEIYSQPVKKQGDAWKDHGLEEDNEHTENYDKIKMAALESMVADGPPIPDKNYVLNEEDNDDETYDHFTNVKTVAQSENIYGVASATAVFQPKCTASSKDAASSLYEEPNIAAVKNPVVSEEPLYEEAEVQVRPVFSRNSYKSVPGEYGSYQKKQLAAPSVTPEKAEEEEDLYSDVT